MFGLRRRSATPAPSVVAAREKRDKLLKEAEVTAGAVKEAVKEVDRVQQGIIDDFEQAELERQGK